MISWAEGSLVGGIAGGLLSGWGRNRGPGLWFLIAQTETSCPLNAQSHFKAKPSFMNQA